MVKGLRGFRDWFAGYEEQYAVIGGTACDLLFSESGLEFRATRDIDMVLILESLTPEFGARFWDYIKKAGYEHRNKSSGEPQFYRFDKPLDDDYPFIIELFSRRLDSLSLPSDAVLTPLPIDTEISSLSAILLNSDYYEFLKNGRILIDGVPVLSAAYIIPFKAKAWLDLSSRKSAGESIDSKNVRKHRNDVFRISALLSPDTRVVLPDSIRSDIVAFVEAMKTETIDLKSLGVSANGKEDVLAVIAATYLT